MYHRVLDRTAMSGMKRSLVLRLGSVCRTGSAGSGPPSRVLAAVRSSPALLTRAPAYAAAAPLLQDEMAFAASSVCTKAPR